MFARAASVFVLALPVLAAASAVPRNNGDQCTTGSLQCCSSVQDASSSVVSLLLGLLGISVGSVTGQVGVTCSPITVIGTGSTSCSEQPVCCTDNSFNGLISLGCTPVNMFARATAAVLVALPILAAAQSDCTTGSLQCCSSVQDVGVAAISVVTTLLGLLGIVLGDVTGQVGLNCSPITVIGASGTDCNEQPVCCTGNTFNGLITVGCTPVNVNL
ncbi:hypothetical protein CVT26_003827 [Gymnopilus dilepis]|uniref:Hydrophobin n=1 Tax=Gymnopilus dilepis TaxID=231916 RepID=A0A409WKM7_9AGAR|nr:hypothetical protein CVT26_003827 [Gymnopilus dilepis]